MANGQSEEDQRPTKEVVPPKMVSVTLAEMGQLCGSGERSVHLSTEFLTTRLRPTCFDDILVEHGAKPRDTGVVCPFCGTGCLTLLKLDPLYRAEGRNERRPQDQIGSKYLYECSNRDCCARFFGNYLWENAPWEEKRR